MISRSIQLPNPRITASSKRRQVSIRLQTSCSTPAPGGVQLACPVTLKPLDSSGLSPDSGLRYSKDGGVWDLTIGAGKTRSGRTRSPTSLQEVVRSGLPSELRGFLPTASGANAAIFETPLVSFIYEKGWRQAFVAAGFPGPDVEFDLVRGVLREVETKRGVVMDASCASGLFTRRFVQTGAYSQVIAMDYSEAMLRQAKDLSEQEGIVEEDVLTYVRADIARLPLLDNSLDAVHAGAAIHCWPQPKAGVAEVVRVLKPGGIFCGTTFLTPEIPMAPEELNLMVSNLSRDITRPAGLQFWDKQAMQDIFESCGLIDFDCEIRHQFIFFSAKKPFPSSAYFEYDASITSGMDVSDDDGVPSETEARKTSSEDMDDFLKTYDEPDAS